MVNLIDTCQIYWRLLYFKTTTITTSDNTTSDVTEYISCFRDITDITGADYVNWNGNNEYPFTYIANIQGLTIIA